MKQLRDRYGIKGIALSGYGMERISSAAKTPVLGTRRQTGGPQLVAVIERLTSE